MAGDALNVGKALAGSSTWHDFIIPDVLPAEAYACRMELN
jgi:hypothetical protein